jgi:hypothetical protein
MSDEQPDDGEGYELVMPFVATESHGGPYDDQAFVAGYATAQLDQVLRLAAAAQVSALTATIRVELAGQLDLIGMRWGYGLVVDEQSDHPGWATAAFTHTHGGPV